MPAVTLTPATLRKELHAFLKNNLQAEFAEQRDQIVNELRSEIQALKMGADTQGSHFSTYQQGLADFINTGYKRNPKRIDDLDKWTSQFSSTLQSTSNKSVGKHYNIEGSRSDGYVAIPPRKADDEDDLDPDDGEHRVDITARLIRLRDGHQASDRSDSTSYLSGLLDSHEYHIFQGVLTLLNVVWIGIQADCAARYWAHGTLAWTRIDEMFLILFGFDALAKMIAQRLHFFCQAWNWFDLSLVLAQILETFVKSVETNATEESLLQYIPMMRGLRLFRVWRLIRLVEVFSQLRTTIVSIVSSISSLGWLVGLMLGVTYFFAVLVTSVVTEHKITVGREKIEQDQEYLEEFYGTLLSSIIYLYKCISAGTNWDRISMPLVQHISSAFTVVVGLYVTFILFAIKNVITSNFVESTRKAGLADLKARLTEQLHQIFEDDHIRKPAFNASLGTSMMQLYLGEMGITEDQAIECDLFSLLDADGNGYIDPDEFVRCCMRLIGPAKALQLAVVDRNVTMLINKLQAFESNVEPRYLVQSSEGCRCQ